MRPKEAVGTGIDHPAADALDFGRDRCLLPLQLGDARRGIRLRQPHDLPQQREDRQQPRLGADELPLLQALQPLHRLLRGRGQIEFGLVAALRVIFAQKRGLPAGPVLQVLASRFGVFPLAVDLPQMVKIIVQGGRQIALGNRTPVRPDKDPEEKTDDQRGVVGGQQSQGGMGLIEFVEVVVIHGD